MECDSCGSTSFTDLTSPVGRVLECELCGTLAGDDRAVAAVLAEREARERGVDPVIYPLVQSLGKVPGLRVVNSDAGDVETRVWPLVQLGAADGREALRGVENLLKSMRLSAGALEVHWVVEAELGNQLLFSLKPRFHRDVERITPALVAAARRDLGRLHASLERDMRLLWWRQRT